MASLVGTLAVQLKADTSQFSKGIDQATSKIKAFGDKIGGMKALISGVLYGTAVAGLASLVKASSEARLGELQLAQAFATAGKQLDIDALNRFADARERLTTDDNDAVLASARHLVTYGAEQRQIQELIPAVQDLAAAKGIDLRSATDLVGKAFSGNAQMLSRYGIKISDATKNVLEHGSASQRTAELVKLLESRFAGSAETAAKTATGAWRQLQNAIGNLKESMGGIVDSPIAGFLRFVTDKVRDLKTWVDELDPTQRQWIVRLTAISVIGGAVAIAILGIVKAVTLLAPLVAVLFNPWVAGIAAAIAMVVLLKKAWDTNLGGIQDKVRSVAYFFANAFKTAFGLTLDFWDVVIKGILLGIKKIIDGMQKLLDFASKLPGGGAAEFLGGKLAASGASNALGGMAAGSPTRKALDDIGTMIETTLGPALSHAGDVIETKAKDLWVAAKKATIAGVKSAMSGFGEAIDGILGKIGIDTGATPATITPTGGGGGGMGGGGAAYVEPDEHIQEYFRAKAALFKARVGIAVDIMGGAMAKAAPVLAEVVSNAAQGFAQGGVIGAIIAVIVTLLSKLKAVTDIFAMAEGVIGVLLRELNSAFKELNLSGLFSSAFRGMALTIAQGVRQLGPTFRTLGTVFKALGEVLEFFLEGFANIWNKVISLFVKVLKKLNFDSLAEAMKKMKVRLDEVAITADAAAEETTPKVDALGDAAQSVADALSNIPSGYKIALAQFEAIDGSQPMPGQGAGSPAGGGAAEEQSKGSPIYIDRVQVGDPADFIDKLEELQRRRRTQQTGSGHSGSGSRSSERQSTF